MKTNRWVATSLAAITLLSSGCVVAPVGRPYYGEAVVVAPPPPRIEYVGPPLAGHIWIGGYWNWVGGRHEWAPGHWEASRPGYRWLPRRWERSGPHWRQHGGYWDRH